MPAKPGWVLTSSLSLLSLGGCCILRSAWFLSVLQSQPGFLHMLTSHPQRLILTTIAKVMRTEIGWEVVNEACRISGMVVGQLGDPPGRPWNRVEGCEWGMQDLRDGCGPAGGIHRHGLPRVTDMVSRACIYLICFMLSPGCCPPSHSMSLRHVAHNSVFQGRWETKGPLWKCLTQPGKLGTHLNALGFPCGRNHGPSSSLSTELCCLVEGETRGE